MNTATRHSCILLLTNLCLGAFLPLPPCRSESREAESPARFPSRAPKNGSFNRPAEGATLDVSPPGFCWWRAGARSKVFYRLRLARKDGLEILVSPRLEDPVHVPSEILQPGDYFWRVEALAPDNRVLDTLGPRTFTIAPNPVNMPWVNPAELLARVPREHPRLLFPKAKLTEVKKSLGTTRKKAFEDLLLIAEPALSLELMKKPDFNRFDRKTQYAARRVAYREAYLEFTRIYNRGMVPLALAYLLTGEEKYGQAAKAHLLNLLDWETGGIASLESSFDEIGLRIERTAAQAYDWLYDLLSDAERRAVRSMLLNHGDLMYARLRERDFLNHSGSSHDGRLPGYLIEFSIALAEEPRARDWLDYAMRALLTVYPHWAGEDGGWAEGVSYSLSYNDRFITPFQSLYAATGYDLWQKPFFRKFRHFLIYNVAPKGEILPFGDGEDKDISDRGDELVSVMRFHASRYGDPAARWWVGLFEGRQYDPERFGAMHRLILPDTVAPAAPEGLPPDRAFRGIGWAALHSDLVNPDEDLMVMFKSSPFGAVSHSHADQNSFAIMKGGRALAIPGGKRYPQHGSPFHEQYVQQSLAHNVLLVNGKGQINRDGSKGGRIVDFRSTPHIGYVAGDAQKCYGAPLERYVRHVVLIRPSLVLVVDELEASEPVEIEWLMHAKERLELNAAAQTFVSRRRGASMKTQLFAPGDLDFAQTDAWPVEPKKGYSMVTAPEPEKQWHFTAKTRQRARKWRIAAVMTVSDKAVKPAVGIRRPDERTLELDAFLGANKASVRVNLDPKRPEQEPLIEIRYLPVNGEVENLSIM